MILLVGFYLDRSDERVQEFLSCVKRNTDDRKIGAVYVYSEDAIDCAAPRPHGDRSASTRQNLAENS